MGQVTCCNCGYEYDYEESRYEGIVDGECYCDDCWSERIRSERIVWAPEAQQRIAELEAQLAAATERADRAERALRLECGNVMAGDLPPGWTYRDPYQYQCGNVVVRPNPYASNGWIIVGVLGRPTSYNTAAEAIEAAQRALEGE